MRVSVHLPTRDDGLEGLLSLPDTLAVPTAEAYRFLGFIRDNNNGAPVVHRTRGILAVRTVKLQQALDASSVDEARVKAAHQLGYPPFTRPRKGEQGPVNVARQNFYVLLDEALGSSDERHDPYWTTTALAAGTLPGPADGVDGLLALLPTYGIADAQLFQFLGWLRHSTGATIVGAARQIMAARMTLSWQSDHPGEEIKVARVEVAKKLGYDLHARPNFYKRVASGLQLLDERGEM
jgi:hypothetical protein